MNYYKNLFRLDDQVAVVTGGVGILGAELCKAFCELGASVACVDVQEKEINTFVKNLQNTYGEERIKGYFCDVSNPDLVTNVTKNIILDFNKIDILINNAAARPKEINDNSFEDYPLEMWRKVMSVNLDGMFLMAQSVGRHMVERKQGAIVQTSSLYSLLAPDHRIYEGGIYNGKGMGTPAVYTTSKAGVIGLTKHLATLWAEHGIRVNAICPGGVTSGQNNEFNRRYSARVPMGRMAEKIDIIGPMVFLVSNAASYITGQVIYADGGLSAW